MKRKTPPPPDKTEPPRPPSPPDLGEAGEPALLVKVEGEEGVARFVRRLLIGRAPDVDLVIDDPSVSQRHVEVVFEEGGWSLRDLKSTNGTIVAGKPIGAAIPVRGALKIRLGYQGPALVLTPEGVADDASLTATDIPSESLIVERYMGKRAPENMGEHTAALRLVFAKVQRQKARRYLLALTVLALLVVAASGYAYLLKKRIARQMAAAAELFYAGKALEIEVAQLELTAAERQSYRAQRDELEKRYRDLVDELGIYSDKTPEEVQIIYRVTRRFGESEVNVPPEFIDEVQRYIGRWKKTRRLRDAIERARKNGYGQRIAEIMLEHDIPPDLFYVALQESNFRVEAVGPETRYGFAKGMWQFIPGTARDYGLKTGPLVGLGRRDPLDERHDFEKSTQAAAQYLRRIYTTDAQASGLLVIASYNWGQSNVLKLIRTMPQSPHERNFWQLFVKYRERIPHETYDYVLNIVSAAVIGENPALFGFDFEVPFERPQPVAETVVDAP